MIFLLLTIFLNTYLALIFKITPKFKIDNFQMIVVNYWVCVLTGSLFIGHLPFNLQNTQQPWFKWSVIMGFGFIAIFNLIAYCTKKSGIVATAVANKLSMIIPVIFAFLFLKDQLNWMKIMGISLGVPAVYLATKSNEKSNLRQGYLIVLLFVGSGLLDTLVSYVTAHFFNTNNEINHQELQSVYLIHSFAMAGLVGLSISLILLFKKKIIFSYRNVLAGVVLGIPNFFSIYFLMRLLNSGYLQASAAIPVNNIGVLFCATIAAFLFFKESISIQKIVGLILSLAAIFFLFLADKI